MAGVTFSSNSPTATRFWASKLARKISKNQSRRHAMVIALNGDLGAGKTVFAKGLAKGLGIKKTVNSPTFLIFKIYSLKKERGFQNFIHVDAYRLKSAVDLKILKFPELLKNPKNIVLIEWAENVKKIIPANSLRIKILSGRKEKDRVLKIIAGPVR